MNKKKVLLQAVDLYKQYGSGEGATVALKGVNLSVYEGELLVILGSSGSGKSTLLNMIGGMASPTSGQIWVNGMDICKFNDQKLTAYRGNVVGFVFQSFNLIQELTAEENVALVADKTKPGIVDSVFEMVGLSDKRKNYPFQMSGGQQQRVSIARALAKRSSFLLCDEPTGALDYETGKQVLENLEDLSRKYHRTVIIVTHTKEIGRMADRVVRMRSGRIVEELVNPNPIAARDIDW